MLEWWYKYNNWLVLPSMAMVLVSNYFYSYFNDELRWLFISIAFFFVFIKVSVYAIEYFQERNNPKDGGDENPII